MGELDDVTLGELARRVDRLDEEMRAGFAQLRDDIRGLSFVPAGVYASDRSADHERITRLETAARTAEQRAWQARTSLYLAIGGVPLSVIASVIGALILIRLT